MYGTLASGPLAKKGNPKNSEVDFSNFISVEVSAGQL